MFHLSAFYRDLGAAAYDGPLQPVSDGKVTFGGNLFFMPQALPFLAAGWSLDEEGEITRAKFTSPKLDNLGGYELYPIGNTAPLGFGYAPNFLHKGPINIERDEGMGCDIVAGAGTANQAYGLMMFSDGPLQEVNGEINQVRATSTITGVADGWTEGELTFVDPLPSGTFHLVGCQTIDANAVASRINFSGASLYPGLPAISTLNSSQFIWYTRGMGGIWGEFTNRTIPYIQVLGAATGTQTHFIDLIYKGK